MMPFQGLGMIRKVVLRRFKRFQEETFEMPGHIVLAGSNNTGKTTVLQALAAWGLAISRWKELNDFRTHNAVRHRRFGLAGGLPCTSIGTRNPNRKGTTAERQALPLS